MLKAIKNVGDKMKDKIAVVATYCGAHAIPKGKTEEEQTADVINNQIPAIEVTISSLRVSLKKAKLIHNLSMSFAKESSSK
jgi:coenzyme F420-reducing hydrogenase beta subunit